MPEEKPFANEHSCRLKPPDYDNYARKNCYRKSDGKCVDYIFGIIGPDESELQALRYKTKIWTESAARAHCKTRKGTFEPAKKESNMRAIEIYLKSGDTYESSVVTSDELEKWYKENTDKEGNVKEEIIVFQECLFKMADDETIEWTLSDYTLDRDLERIDPEGWDLKNFRKNPIVLWAHEYYRPAIGKILKPRVQDGKLKGNVKFNNKETDEFGWGIGQRVREGVINTGSVGFRSKKIEIIEDDKDPTRLIHRKQELYEFSVCNVPANVNARPTKMDDKGNVDYSDKEPPDSKEIMLPDISCKIDELRQTVADMHGKREIGEVRDKLADIEIRISSIEKILKPQSYIDELFEEDAGRKISVQDDSADDKPIDKLLGIKPKQEETHG